MGKDHPPQKHDVAEALMPNRDTSTLPGFSKRSVFPRLHYDLTSATALQPLIPELSKTAVPVGCNTVRHSEFCSVTRHAVICARGPGLDRPCESAGFTPWIDLAMVDFAGANPRQSNTKY